MSQRLKKERGLQWPYWPAEGALFPFPHREPERYGFTLDEHFSGAARVLSMQSTDILMKDKCQPSVIARLRVLQAARKHETRRQDTFSGRT